jgi:hypothetical protein
MIVRVQGERQYRLDDAARRELEEIDGRLVGAVRGGDAEATHQLLAEAIALVSARGEPLGEADLAPSDLILPPADATLDETSGLLESEGMLA